MRTTLTLDGYTEYLSFRDEIRRRRDYTSDDSKCSGVSFSDPQTLRWLQHPLVDIKEIGMRQSMIETICSEMELIDTLQNGSGMLRGLPGERRRLRQRVSDAAQDI